MIQRSKVAVIAAIDEEGGFSKDGKLPFSSKADLKRFKKITKGNVCIMGRKTYDEMVLLLKPKEGQPLLADRESYVLTSTPEEVTHGIGISDLGAVHLYMEDPRTFFFIGGERIFWMGLQLADSVEITVFNGNYGCDKFLPMYYLEDMFTIIKCEAFEQGSFVSLTRKVIQNEV